MARSNGPYGRIVRKLCHQVGFEFFDHTPYEWPRWLAVEEPGVLVPVVRRPEHRLVLRAGDPARSRSAYGPAQPYNRPVTKQVVIP